MNVKPPHTIVGLGEALIDVFPDGSQRLGGAPLNFAVHAHQLLAHYRAGEGIIVSRVGTDFAAETIIAALVQRGLTADEIQIDHQVPTGRCIVSIAHDEPNYALDPHSAWDHIQWTPRLAALSQRCSAVCWGTLAQRALESHQTIQRYVKEATQAIRIFDINWRPGSNLEVLRQDLHLANVVKVSQGEMDLLAGDLGITTAHALRERFDLHAVVLTRGSQGTLLITAAGPVTSGEPVPDVEVMDTVGAGDAACAAVATGLVLGWPYARIARTADLLGAFVASQPGATPLLPPDLLPG